MCGWCASVPGGWCASVSGVCGWCASVPGGWCASVPGVCVDGVLVCVVYVWMVC